MSKLYYRWGVMDSSKTARLLMDAHEYKQRGEWAMLIRPINGIRSEKEKGKIISRIGLEADCLDIDSLANPYSLVLNLEGKPACIFVDEAQFLTHEQVIGLRMIVNVFGIPVMCYGLKSDFVGNLFEGSKALFEHANRNEEVKTICRQEGCRSKAMYNGRFKDGKPVFEGDQVAVGDTEDNAKQDDGHYYIPKCSRHFFEDYMAYNMEKRSASK